MYYRHQRLKQAVVQSQVPGLTQCYDCKSKLLTKTTMRFRLINLVSGMSNNELEYLLDNE